MRHILGDCLVGKGCELSHAVTVEPLPRVATHFMSAEEGWGAEWDGVVSSDKMVKNK